MRATQIIQTQFESDLLNVHLARVRVVFVAALTLLKSGTLTLTSLGRAIAEHTAPKHGIKRIDRLLGNRRLHGERLTFYRAIARRVVPTSARPLILIDWTAVTPDLWALAAAVPFEGRAVVVYAETHPISRYMKPYVNAAFLRRVAAILPPGPAPIVVADAGFRSPFMKLVAGLGWDCIVRLRSRANVRPLHGDKWIRIPELFARARLAATDLGPFEIGERGRYRCRLVSIRNRVHHRKHRARTRARGVGADRVKASAHEPWILATSLELNAKRIVAMYARRMQIEETFRDAKDPHFGLALKYARTKSEARANVLVLLANLAHLISILLGIVGEAAKLHLRFQANTIKNKRVLSLPMVGRLVASRGAAAFIAPELIQAACLSLRERADHASAV